MSYADIPGFMAPEYEDFYRVMAERLPTGAKVVEVGCAYGRSLAFLGEELLKRKKIAALFAVDTWTDFMGCERDDWIGEAAREAKAAFPDARAAFVEFLKAQSPEVYKMVIPYRMPSIQAADALAIRAPFDLVFIDANHTEEDVAADIICWTGNVGRGGILAGDDYDVATFPGVVTAVDKYARFRSQVFTTRGRIWIQEVR